MFEIFETYITANGDFTPEDLLLMRFASENSWTTDHESFKIQTPSSDYIQALENTEVVLWTRENLAKLHTAIPAFKSYMERLMDSGLKASKERVLRILGYTSEEKYEDFITSFPDVFRRVPLHMVASYLGVSRETLSRIRQARLKL